MTLCRRDRSTPRLSWSPASLWTRRWCHFGYLFGHRRRFGGRPSRSTETNLLRHRRSALTIRGRCHRVIRREVPPCSILLDAQPMGGRQMAAQHLAAIAAIHANDEIRRDRAADRNRRGSLDDGFLRRLTEAGEHRMDSRNHAADLVGPDLIASQIGADDRHSEFSIGRCSRRFIGHSLSPKQTGTLPYPVNSRRRLRLLH